MFAVADTVSRLEWKRVPRFLKQLLGHESGKVRAKKAQEGWQELALTIAKEKKSRLSVARVTDLVICDERWTNLPKECRPKKRHRSTISSAETKKSMENEERLQVN